MEARDLPIAARGGIVGGTYNCTTFVKALVDKTRYRLAGGLDNRRPMKYGEALAAKGKMLAMGKILKDNRNKLGEYLRDNKGLKENSTTKSGLSIPPRNYR